LPACDSRAKQGESLIICHSSLIMKYITTINGNEYQVELLEDGRVLVNGEEYDTDVETLGSGVVSMIVNNRSYEAAVASPERDQWEILLNGEIYQARVQDERAYRLAKARGELDADTGEVPTKSPMPGVIVSVQVSEGEAIVKGQTLVILESMKMENELKATRDGIIVAIKTSAGASVEKGAVLVVVGDAEEE